MRKVLQFKDIAEVTDCMESKVFNYINQGQTESFECFENFDLLAFDCYDIQNEDINNKKIMIYLDRDDLFFFCEDEKTESKVNWIIRNIADKETLSNEQLIYYFFVNLLKNDMAYLDSIEEQINDEEPIIFADSERNALERISEYRKKLLKLKRYYEQLDLIFDEMTPNDNDLLSEKIIKRMIILGARTDRYLNCVRNLQETVNQMREAYQSQLSIKQNELMKVFTVVTVIFLPLSLIAGWYGMNFADMPEYTWKYSYPALIVISAAIVLLLVWFFKRKKWL